MVTLLNFDAWKEYEGMSAGSGRSEKIWLRSPDNESVGLFKYPKSEQTTEHVSEHMTCTIAKFLNISCANVDIGTYQGRTGSISYLINETPKEILIESIEFITKVYPKYNSDKMVDEESGRRYSLEMLLPILESLSRIGKKDYFAHFFEMLVFDALIGNSDRHQNNWAFLLKLFSDFYLDFAPLYDNGSSLCCYVLEKDIDKKFLSRDKLPFHALADTKSRSMIRIENYSRSNPTHREMMEFLSENYYLYIDSIINRIEKSLTSENISSIVENYPDNILSPNRKVLIKTFLTAKTEMIYNFKKEEFDV